MARTRVLVQGDSCVVTEARDRHAARDAWLAHQDVEVKGLWSHRDGYDRASSVLESTTYGDSPGRCALRRSCYTVGATTGAGLSME